jgi:hypothetical protein
MIEFSRFRQTLLKEAILFDRRQAAVCELETRYFFDFGAGTMDLTVSPSEAPPVALLAAVPEVHLISGREVCAKEGRVAFGSRDFLVFRELESLLAGKSCDVLIYASLAANPQPGLPKVTWKAKYARVHNALPDGSPPKGVIRPLTAERNPRENKGWAVYWEVSDLEMLPKSEFIPISQLRGYSGKNYAKGFRPERPLIIQAL